MKLQAEKRGWPFWIGCAVICSGCIAPEADMARDVGARIEPLEFSCLAVAADGSEALTGPSGNEVISIQPYEPSTAQEYGSLLCSGFVIDIHNPNGRSATFAAIAAGGWVRTPQDYAVFGEPETCAAMTLEADIWGYRNGVWDVLGADTISGEFENDVPTNNGSDVVDGCGLQCSVVRPGNYETYRLVGRASNQLGCYGVQRPARDCDHGAGQRRGIRRFVETTLPGRGRHSPDRDPAFAMARGQGVG
jgi:hypothetical protein